MITHCNPLVRARLNLFAVLQNIEDLVRLDAESKARTRDWRETIQFAVWGGPAAYLSFADGVCRHGCGKAARPSIVLGFVSPGHLNAMFEGRGTPVPLKGFTKLGFLKNEFAKLTDRLTYFLKPQDAQLADPEYLRINTYLTLNTAAYAAAELTQSEDISRGVAAHVADGAIRMGIQPDGPWATLKFEGGMASAHKGNSERSRASMVFRNEAVANALLNNRLDAFLGVAQGDVVVKGRLDMLDSLGLILDRVPMFLS